MRGPNQRDSDLFGGRELAAWAVRHRPLALLWGAVRGCAVCAICVAAGFAVAKVVVTYVVVPAPQSPCIEDWPCLPDFGAIFTALVIIAVVVPLASPLVAWLVRLPRPWFFALPGLWVSALAVSGLISADVLVMLILVLAPYALLAIWSVSRTTKQLATPSISS